MGDLLKVLIMALFIYMFVIMLIFTVLGILTLLDVITDKIKKKFRRQN